MVKDKAFQERMKLAIQEAAKKAAEQYQEERRIRDAFRRDAESGDYDPRVFRLLAKGDPKFEAIVEDYLAQTGRD